MRIGLMQDERSISAELAHKKAKLKNDIVTRAEHLCGSGLDQIVGSEDHYGEIKKGQRLCQTLDKRLPQCKDTFIPRVVLKRRPDRSRKIYTLRRRLSGISQIAMGADLQPPRWRPFHHARAALDSGLARPAARS